MQIGEPMAYNIVFYEKQNGESELLNFLEKLRKKSATDKDARIQYKQASLYIELLQNSGTRLPATTAFFISFVIKMISCFFIVFVRRHKKHLAEKLKKQNPNAMIIYPERSPKP